MGFKIFGMNQAKIMFPGFSLVLCPLLPRGQCWMDCIPESIIYQLDLITENHSAEYVLTRHSGDSVTDQRWAHVNTLLD